MHIQFQADLTNNTGTINWFDIDDPNNPARGVSEPLQFNRSGLPAGDNWPIDTLWMSTVGAGFDNVCVATTPIPELTSLILLALDGLSVLTCRRRRRRES